jgi:hypothetical protein
VQTPVDAILSTIARWGIWEAAGLFVISLACAFSGALHHHSETTPIV